MNHAQAAEVRDALNALRCVQAPGDDRGNQSFRLVRVVQPGYLNGEPIYEVRVRRIRSPTGETHLPGEFLAVVADAETYLRIDDDEIHIRDWRVEDEDDSLEV